MGQQFYRSAFYFILNSNGCLRFTGRDYVHLCLGLAHRHAIIYYLFAERLGSTSWDLYDCAALEIRVEFVLMNWIYVDGRPLVFKTLLCWIHRYGFPEEYCTFWRPASKFTCVFKVSFAPDFILVVSFNILLRVWAHFLAQQLALWVEKNLLNAQKNCSFLSFG